MLIADDLSLVIVNNGAIIATWTTLDLFLYLFVVSTLSELMLGSWCTDEPYPLADGPVSSQVAFHSRLTDEDSDSHIAFNLPLGKLYSISFFLTQIFRGGYSKDNEMVSLGPVNPSNEV